jgi:hypothetical protein
VEKDLEAQPNYYQKRPRLNQNGYPILQGYCGHHHTSFEQSICDMFNYPLDHCKFHENTTACRYYCRKLNEK